jgi:HlyD family secretion protein
MLTEILSGIGEGAEVLVDFKLSGGDMPGQDQQAQNPFMPRPRGNNRQQNGNGNRK